MRILQILTRQKYSAPEKVADHVRSLLCSNFDFDTKFLFPPESGKLNLRHLRGIIKAMKSSDIVHSHGLIPDLFTAMFCSKAKRVTTLHVDPSLDLKNKTNSTLVYAAAHFVWSLALSRFRYSVSVNEHIRERYFNLGNGNIAAVIRNTIIAQTTHVDPLKTKTIREMLNNFRQGKDHIIAATAVLSRLKRLDLLIASVPELIKKIKIGVVIIGEGPAESELKALSKKLNAQDSILFCGRVDQPYQYYDLIHSFYSGSISEGSSLALIEAISNGVPIIASRIPANIEIFGTDCSLLFDPNDQSSLVKAITHCQENILNLKTDALRLYRKHFSNENFKSSYLNLYEEIISRK